MIKTPASPPDRFAEAMSRADGCPNCVTNTETPYKVLIEADGFTGYYHCADCDELWTTSWGEC